MNNNIYVSSPNSYAVSSSSTEDLHAEESSFLDGNYNAEIKIITSHIKTFRNGDDYFYGIVVACTERTICCQ